MKYIYVVSRGDMVLDATTSRTLRIEFCCEYLVINIQPSDYESFVKIMTKRIRDLERSMHTDCGRTLYSHDSGVTVKVSVFRVG